MKVSWNNEVLNIHGLLNTIKNLSLNLSLPNKATNELTSKVVQKIHKYLEVTPGDPRTTMGAEDIIFHFHFMRVQHQIHCIL